ncbi:MAG: RNA-binding protein [Rhodospirillales bacterium]|nr:RNA-binding protein [Rhodospirillales bacterium]
MPKGPKGEKRPVDVVANAVKVMRIATGEEEEDLDDEGKNKAAVALGKKGGRARADKMTAEQRSEIAKQAAAKRWGNG